MKTHEKVLLTLIILSYIFTGWYFYAPCSEQELFKDCGVFDIFMKGFFWVLSPVSSIVIGIYHIGVLLSPSL